MASPSQREILEAVTALARQYPAPLADEQLADAARIADHVSIVIARARADGRLLDLCGGIGLFSVSCAALGMQVTLVDDFQDSNNRPVADEALRLHRSRGVTVIQADVLTDPLAQVPAGCLDVLTCFDALEHWPKNPRSILHRAMSWLKPGGLFVLQTPNAVNLRKRLTVPLGIGDWSPFDHWYSDEVFRGHIREPSVRDLRKIAADLALNNVEILGRNWLGYSSRFGFARILTRLLDKPLRLRPTLCSNIYLIGRKP